MQLRGLNALVILTVLGTALGAPYPRDRIGHSSNRLSPREAEPAMRYPTSASTSTPSTGSGRIHYNEQAPSRYPKFGDYMADQKLRASDNRRTTRANNFEGRNGKDDRKSAVIDDFYAKQEAARKQAEAKAAAADAFDWMMNKGRGS